MSAAERSAGATSHDRKPALCKGPVVINTFAEQGPDPLIDSYEQGFRAEAAEGEDLAAQLERAPATVQAVQHERSKLLDALPLGDLSGKVCVDFGVGRHGFAARFPKLQGCARAVGVELSYTAVKASAAVSERGRFGYGRNYTYLTSRGDRIDLEDGTADLFYAGESIERVESAEAFLEEVHRLLKPGGLLVLTTVQAEPLAPCQPPAPPPAPTPVPTPAPAAVAPPPPRGLISRLSRAPRKAMKHLGRLVRADRSLRRVARFVKHRLVSPAAPVDPAPDPAPDPDPAPPAVALSATPDHLGALTYAELCRCLCPRFEIVEAHGYGGPLPGTAAPPAAPGDCSALAPERAGAVILLARRRDEYRPGPLRLRRHAHDGAEVHYRGGPWEVTGLHGALTGRVATGGEASWLLLPFEGESLTLYFWSHPWSGEAVIDVDGVQRSVNLYSPVGCMKRVPVSGLPPGKHQLRISGSPNRDPRSVGNQVIFYQALAAQRESGAPAPAVRAVGKRRPEERELLRQRIAARRWWFHTVDLGDGLVTPGCDHSKARIGYLGLPERLDGLSVLDVGAYDGFFSFECERRGADRVVAADHFCWTEGGMGTKDGFDLVKAALGSHVEAAAVPVEEISPQRVGVFDLVLFLGVLYHAPDPLGYLRIVRSVCRGQVILETETDAEDYPLPAAVFYPGATLNNDVSNCWGPNLLCIEAMLKEAGFRRIERICTFNIQRRGTRPFHRAVFHAFV